MLDEYSKIFAEDQDKTRQQIPTLTELAEPLIKGMEMLPHVYLFIDAVNESERSAEIVQFATQLAKQCKCARLILSSTRAWDREAHGDDIRVFEVEMSAKEVDKDVSSFIETALRQNPVLSKFSQRLKNDIGQTLLSQSNGM